MTMRGNKPRTMSTARMRGRHLVRVLGGETDTHLLGPAEIDHYVRTRRGENVSDHTIHKELTLLGLGLRVGKRHARFLGDPNVTKPPSVRDYYTPRDRWLPLAEYQALMAQATEHRRPWIQFYCNTGVRHMEAHLIRKQDVQEGQVWVPGTKTAAAGRWVPLNDAAQAAVETRMAAPGDLLFAPVWQRGRMHGNLKTWCKRAKIEPASANDLRRTFCSWMAQAGVPELVIMRIMGHTSSAMVRRVYAHLSPGVTKAAVDRLPTVTLL